MLDINSMNLKAINIGTPKTYKHNGRTFETAIIKTAIDHTVNVYSDHIEGDQVSNTKNHGGIDKAIYLYPQEHYTFWQENLNCSNLPSGSFGENLTTTGLLEDDIHIGDHFKINDVVVEVSQPREPCYKLNMVFNDNTIVKQYLASNCPGIYLRVIQTGSITTGDAITKVKQCPENITIGALWRLTFHNTKNRNQSTIKAALRIKELASSWKTTLTNLVV